MRCDARSARGTLVRGRLRLFAKLAVEEVGKGRCITHAYAIGTGRDSMSVRAASNARKARADSLVNRPAPRKLKRVLMKNFGPIGRQPNRAARGRGGGGAIRSTMLRIPP